MGRQRAAVDDFVERFAGDLEAAGVPRLPARVFVALLVEDDGYLSAAELAERLHISPATVQRHTINLYRKIGARGRGEASANAVRHGIADAG